MDRNVEWAQPCEALVTVSAKHGTNDAFGDGDYWVVDDDWGGYHQKICVTRNGFWTNEIQAVVQRALADNFQNWGLYVVFETSTGRSDTEEVPFVLYQDGVSSIARWV